MLRIRHLKCYYSCSERTAQRRMKYYRDLLGYHDVTIADFLRVEHISQDDFKKCLQMCKEIG